jgi:hypothetical protein
MRSPRRHAIGHYACVREVRTLLVVLVLLAVSSCGGGGAHGAANATVTTPQPVKPTPATLLAAMTSAMSAVHTFRFEVTSGPTHAEGVADVATHYVTLRTTQGMSLDMSMIQRGARTFVRGPTGDWCWTTNLTQSKQPDASAGSPFAILDSLRRIHARVQRIGYDQIRGVEADHYRVPAKPAIDIWVDDQDRLVRATVSLTFGGVHIASTTDLFDFGTAVDAPTPPPNAPHCETG